ncbi:MAG: protein kinase [Planctomycetales bacterium]|nr:protein kinase [Planctomycetales bacterium]
MTGNPEDPPNTRSNVIDPLGPLLDEFLERFRAGENPSISEFVRRAPEYELEIRDLFPTLATLEQAGDGDGGTFGANGSIVPGIKLHRLGEYCILREIGRGGMGIVYEAEQESLGRHVALKVLPNYALFDPKHLHRFHREARAAAQLHHSNIVPVFGVGEDRGIHYYAMQYINGLGLDAVLNELRSSRFSSDRKKKDVHRVKTSPETERLFVESPLLDQPRCKSVNNSLEKNNASSKRGSEEAIGPVVEPNSVVITNPESVVTSASDTNYYRNVARLGKQIAGALSYAHSIGVLHRDIKPSNLLLDAQGQVWVTDFGLAKSVGDDLTHTGDLVGTLRYMAPERFRGWSDPRSDIYSLGLTLYELLTLQPAFDQKDRTRLIKQVTQDFPIRPRKIDPQIPRDLETIVLKAIEKEPSVRFQSAEELEADLIRFVDGRPIHARRASTYEVLALWCRRNPPLATLTVTVCLLIVCLAVGGILGTWRLRAENTKALRNLARATKAESRERTARQLADLHAYDALLATARARRWSGRPGQSFQSLKAIEQAASLVGNDLTQQQVLDLRNEAIAAMTLFDVETDVRHEQSPTVHASHHRWAYDSGIEKFASTDNQGKLVIRDLKGLQVVQTLPAMHTDAESLPYLRYSPNDRYLGARGVWDDGKLAVRIYDLWSPAEPIFSQDIIGTIFQRNLEFSRDSSLCVYASGYQLIVLQLVPTVEVLHNLQLEHETDFVCFGPTNEQVLTGREDKLTQVDIMNFTSPRTLPMPERVIDADWSPDGRFIAAGCRDGSVIIFDTRKDYNSRKITDGHRNEVRYVQFDSKGSWLLSTSWDATTRIWDPFLSQEVLCIDGTASQFSETSEMLSFELANSLVGRWRTSANAVCQSIWGLDHRGEIVDIDFSSDGEYMVTASRFEGLTMRRLNDRTVIAQWRPYYETRNARFSPDGQSLLTSGSGRVDRWPIEVIRQGDIEKLLQRRQTLASGDVNFPTEMDITADGQLIASMYFDNVRRIQTAGPQRGEDCSDIPVSNRTENLMDIQLRGHNSAWFVAISPNGRWGVSTGKGASGFQVTDLENLDHAQEVQSVSLPGSYLGLLAFSPDSKQCICSTSTEYQVFDTSTWTKTASISRAITGVGEAQFSCDGRLLALEDQFEIRLLDAKTYQLQAVLPGPLGEQLNSGYPEGAGGLRFSPDNRYLAVGTQRNTVQLWDIEKIHQRLQVLGLDWLHEAQTENLTTRDYLSD